jgi:hypothetical protein
MDIREIKAIVDSRVAASAPLYRWVDDKGALAYIRRDAMVGRTKHYIPKAMIPNVNKYGRATWFTGLSFSRDDARWNIAGSCCFVVSGIPNDCFNINGQAVYNYGQAVASRSCGPDELQQYEQNAVEDSQNEPDETFVVGNIQMLSKYLAEIRIKNSIPPKVLAAVRSYSEQNNIQLTVVGQ